MDSKLFISGAIEPKLIADMSAVYTLSSNLLGAGKGRFIEGIPAGWFEEVKKEIGLLDDIKLRALAEELIKQYKTEFTVVNFKAVQKRYNDWNRQIQDFLTQDSIDFVLQNKTTEKSKGMFDGMFDIDKIKEFAAYLENISGFISIEPKTKRADLVKQLVYFFYANRRVYLINPTQWLFHGDESNVGLVKSCIETWIRNDGIEFQFIRSQNNSNYNSRTLRNEIEMLEQLLASHERHGDFFYSVVDDQRTHKLHERYLLGPYTGIEMGYGLELRDRELRASRERPQTWKLIPEAARHRLWDTFANRSLLDLYGVSSVLRHFVSRKL